MSMQQLKQCLPLDKYVGLVKLDCEGCEFEVVPSNTRFFSTWKRRVVGEFHAWHLKQPGHTGNVSDEVIRDVKALLCNRRAPLSHLASLPVRAPVEKLVA
jgi:hypothetical protein